MTDRNQIARYRHPRKDVYGRMAVILLLFFLLTLFSKYFSVNEDPDAVRTIHIIMYICTLGVIAVSLVLGSERTLIADTFFEIQIAFLFRKRVSFSDITGYRRCKYSMKRLDYAPLWLYQDEKCLGDFGDYPGMDRVAEILRERGCQPVFSGRNTPDRFRVGYFLRVEDGNLCRGKMRVPLRDVRASETALYAPDGKRMGNPGPETANADLLAWLLVQEHKDLTGTVLGKALL